MVIQGLLSGETRFLAALAHPLGLGQLSLMHTGMYLQHFFSGKGALTLLDFTEEPLFHFTG